MDRPFRDLQTTPKGHSRSKSLRTFTKWAMVNIFVNRHQGPRSNGYDATLDFHFRDLEMTPSRSSGVKFFNGILKVRNRLSISVS